MTDAQVKQAKIEAVKGTAQRLLKANNTVTTLEIKAELVVKYPGFYWDQVTVSSYMENEYQGMGMTYTTNGNYRVYSYAGKKVNQPIATKRSVGRPRKSVATVTSVTAAPSLPSSGKPISKAAALALIENAGGTYFTATFVKKNGEKRTMNCQLTKTQGSSKLGYITVRIPGKLKAGENAIRNVNLQTLKELKIKGNIYKVN